MPKYQNGKIYKIVSNLQNKVYIGCTTTGLSQRMSGHRSGFSKYKKQGKPYCTSYEVLKFDDARILLIEAYPCNSKEELLAREGFFIEETDCVNKNRSSAIVQKQFAEENKELNKVPKSWKAIQQKSYMDRGMMKRTNTIICECGGQFKDPVSKIRHYKTEMHRDYYLDLADERYRQVLREKGCSEKMVRWMFPYRGWRDTSRGVFRASTRGNSFWVARMVNDQGHTITRSFNIDTLGEQEAKHQAIEKRMEWEQQFNFFGEFK